MPSVTRWGKTPEQDAAHRAVARAIKAGEIVAPDACTVCGKESRLIPHHDSYERPLDVRFLCGRCHKQHHFAAKHLAEALA